MHNVAVSSAASTGSRSGAGLESSRSIDQVGSGVPGALGSAADLSRLARGLRIENVQVFSGFSSNGIPASRAFAPGAALLGSDMDVGVSTTISYRRIGRHSNFSVAYSPSHTSRFRFNEWTATNHVVSLGFSKEIGARWGLAIHSDSGLVGLPQAWYVAPTLHRVENPPTTIEDLMERAAAGEFTDDEVASLLTGAPVIDDPGGVGLGLSRVARASANVSLSYAHSPRMSMTFSGGGSTYQVINDDGPDHVNFLRRSDLLTGNVGMKYKLDSRTTVGAGVSSRRIDSNFQRAQSNQLTFSYAKVLRSRWKYSVHGGGGVSDNRSNSVPAIGDSFFGRSSTIPTWVLGGSLGYSGRANTFSLSASRDAGDYWGTGATATVSAGLNWQWMRPTSSWGLSAGAVYFHNVAQQNFRNLESGLVNAGLVQRLSASTLIRTDYIYSRYASAYRGLIPNISIHRVQATVVWTPPGRRR